MRKLSQFVDECESTGLVVALIIDGSFVTAKDEPSDIDLILILRPDHDYQAELRPFESNILARPRVRTQFRFDILLAPVGSIRYEECVGFFQGVKKGNPDRRKGLVEVLL